MINDKPVGEPAYISMYETSVARVSFILKKESSLPKRKLLINMDQGFDFPEFVFLL